MSKIYRCYKLARNAADEHATRLIGNVDSQAMSVNAGRREILQQWQLPGRPETYRMYFRWEACCGH